MKTPTPAEVAAGKILVDKLVTSGHDIGLAAWFPINQSTLIFLLNSMILKGDPDALYLDINRKIDEDELLKRAFEGKEIRIISRDDQISRDFRLAIITDVVNQGIQIRNSTFGKTFMDGVVLYLSR